MFFSHARGRRLLTTALTLVAALALALPAFAWDQQGADGGNTRQAAAEGPGSPGLKWHTDLADEGYIVDSQVTNASTSTGNEPRLGGDGTLVMRARTTDDDVTIGLDPADGSVAWEITGTEACGPAIDSQDRLWVVLDEDEHAGIDEPALAAFDPSTGQEHANTRIELGETDGISSRPNWCARNSVLIGGDGASERLILISQFRSDDDYVLAIDVSGTSPSVDWLLDGHEQDLEWDEILRASGTDRTGVTSSDTLYIPTQTGDTTLQITALDLTDGRVVAQQDLPYYDRDGTPSSDSGDLNRLDTVRLLLSGDRLVAGLKVASGGRTGAVHGLDADDLSIAWTQILPPFHTTAGPGPRLMAVSGDNVVYNPGHVDEHNNTLGANDLETGAPAAWSFEHDVRDGGGGVTFELATDVAGRLYTATMSGSGSAATQALSAFGRGGAELWTFTLDSLADASGLGGDLPSHIHVGPIGDDGTLYLQRYDHVFAIDSSGGLSEQRFADVHQDHPFSDAISWMTFEEITTGYADGTWRPGLDVGRQAVAAFFYRLAGEPEVTTSEPFPDVPTSHPFHDPIAWMVEEEITGGYADGNFHPTRDVSRQAAAAFLYRLDGSPDVTGSAGFSDVPGNHSFHDPIAWMVGEDITGGYSDNTFRPTTPVTRQAVGAFVYRYATN